MKLQIGDKVTTHYDTQVIGRVVFIGATQNIPKILLAEVDWFISKERKPFWIIVELPIEGIKDYDCLDSYESFERIYNNGHRK